MAGIEPTLVRCDTGIMPISWIVYRHLQEQVLPETDRIAEKQSREIQNRLTLTGTENTFGRKHRHSVGLV